MKETELEYVKNINNKSNSYLYKKIKAIINFFVQKKNESSNQHVDKKYEHMSSELIKDFNLSIKFKNIIQITQFLEAGYIPTSHQKKLIEAISKDFVYSDKILSEDEIRNNLYIQRKFNTFVEFKDINTILQFLESGYIPTKGQKTKLNEIIYNLGRELFFDYSTLIQSEVETKLQNLNKFLDFKFEIPISYLIDFLSNKKGDILNDINSIKIRNIPLIEDGISLYPNITKSLSKIIYREDFYLIIFKEKMSEINNKLHQMEDRYLSRTLSRNKLEEICNYIINNKHILFTNISFEEFYQTFEPFKNKNNSSLNNVYAIGMTFYQEDVNKLIHKVKSHYSKEYIDLLVQKEVKEQISLNVLPKDIDSILKDLTSNYKEIMDNSNNILNTTEAKVIFERKVPKIIKEYLCLDEEKRFNFFNIDGKNSHELTLDSLHQINNLFKDFLNNTIQDKVDNISAINRSTHMMNKK